MYYYILAFILQARNSNNDTLVGTNYSSCMLTQVYDGSESTPLSPSTVQILSRAGVALRSVASVSVSESVSGGSSEEKLTKNVDVQDSSSSSKTKKKPSTATHSTVKKIIKPIADNEESDSDSEKASKPKKKKTTNKK